MENKQIKPTNKSGQASEIANWASKYQEQCHLDLDKVGMPSRRSEYWKFVSPELWNNNEILKISGPELSENYDKNYAYKAGLQVNFVNGIVDQSSLKRLSSKLVGSKISDFANAKHNKYHWAADYIGKSESKARCSYERPFALQNGSEVAQGLLFDCKKSPGQPLHIFYYGDEASKASIRHVIKLAEGVQLDIIEHFSGFVKYNVVMEGFLESCSILNHNRLINNSLRSPIITHFFIECMSSSVVNTVGINLSNNAVRNETFLNLEGSECSVTVAGLGIGRKKSSICDNTVYISHNGHSSKSRQIIKNVLSKGARGVFQGKIFVESAAQKTDGYQMSNGLILDEESNFLVKPELEIYADDVVCSHGSISGSINKEHLFYLKSRGIGAKMAQKILIEAYLEEVIKEIEDLKFAEFVRNEIQKVLT